MTIDIGNIYFIKQSFFDLVNDESLPKNKHQIKMVVIIVQHIVQ